MDRIKKFLLFLNKKNRKNFNEILIAIKDLNLSDYDIKPLKGHKGVFRLRKGTIRVIFLKKQKKGIILDIAYRKDIYKNK